MVSRCGGCTPLVTDCLWLDRWPNCIMVALGYFAPFSVGYLGISNRVHRLGLPAHTLGKVVAGTGWGRGLRGWFCRALLDSHYLSTWLNPADTGDFGDHSFRDKPTGVWICVLSLAGKQKGIGIGLYWF